MLTIGGVGMAIAIFPLMRPITSHPRFFFCASLAVIALTIFAGGASAGELLTPLLPLPKKAAAVPVPPFEARTVGKFYPLDRKSAVRPMPTQKATQFAQPNPAFQPIARKKGSVRLAAKDTGPITRNHAQQLLELYSN